MSHIDFGREGIGPNRDRPLDALLIVSCLPVLVVSAVVLVLAGGFNVRFVLPAVVVGATIGMLMYVSLRDRTTI